MLVFYKVRRYLGCSFCPYTSWNKGKKIEETSSSMVSNVHLPYLSMGSKTYLIDDASISSSLQRHKPINIHIISDLPDNVLIHILSFLSTKNAIKTSILSTKWRYLWTYLSVFDFQNFYYLGENRKSSSSLLNVIPTLIHKSNHHLLEIKRLTIDIPRVTLDAHKITSLVTSLVSLKVHDLQFSIDDLKYLYTRCVTRCVLPCGFSASCSLSKLTLKLGGYTLYIPIIGIKFPSLKTLNLSYATFASEESVEDFFSGCPLLEELTLNYCYWSYIKHITIAISTLRILTILFDDPYCLNCEDCDKFSVKIDAVNLLSLTCTSDPTIQFVIVNPPTSMLDAYIAFSLHFPFHYLTHHKYEEYVSHCAAVLLSGLASVKSLSLSNDTFLESPYGNDHFHLLPEFHNLTHLYLHSEICTFSITYFTKFLLKCPKLEVLVFPMGTCALRLTDNYDWKLIPVPCCIKSSLKNLHITSFDGNVCEIQFVEFFLMYATFLEEFQVSLSCSPFSRYNSKNLADLKNRFVGMGSCDIKYRSSRLLIRKKNMACRKCYRRQ